MLLVCEYILLIIIIVFSRYLSWSDLLWDSAGCFGGWGVFFSGGGGYCCCMDLFTRAPCNILAQFYEISHNFHTECYRLVTQLFPTKFRITHLLDTVLVLTISCQNKHEPIFLIWHIPVICQNITVFLFVFFFFLSRYSSRSNCECAG